MSLMLQTLKRVSPTASFHREELGSERSSSCSRSHREQVAEKINSELVTLLVVGDTFIVSVQERKTSPFSLIPGPLGAQLCGGG